MVLVHCPRTNNVLAMYWVGTSPFTPSESLSRRTPSSPSLSPLSTLFLSSPTYSPLSSSLLSSISLTYPLKPLSSSSRPSLQAFLVSLVLRSAALVVGPPSDLVESECFPFPYYLCVFLVRYSFPSFPILCICFPSCSLVPLVCVSLHFSVPFSSIILSTSIPLILLLLPPTLLSTRPSPYTLVVFPISRSN